MAPSPKDAIPVDLTDNFLSMCQASSVVANLSKNEPLSKTNKSPLELFQQLYENVSPTTWQSILWVFGASSGIQDFAPVEPNAENARRTKLCGRFGDIQMSDLFLKTYYNVLRTLQWDPSGDLASPCLAGSSGIVPLTVISTIPDIAEHYYNLILTARSDIFIFSNFWKNSYAARKITDALLELSKLIDQENRPNKVVVKILYDRPNIKQLFTSRVWMTEADWTVVGLPAKKDIPNIDLEVIDYHNFPLGTFHSKFMVVDRKFAVLNSCNIQDNSNLEMMCHLQGDIVESIYEHAILTWGLKLDLPSLRNPDIGSADTIDFDWETKLANDRFDAADGGQKMELVTQCLNTNLTPEIKGTAPNDLSARPFIPYVHTPTSRVPIALVNRKPYAAIGNLSLPTPQDAAWLSAIKFATKSIYIQTPDLNSWSVIPALIDAIKRGVEVTVVLCLGYNDLGEMIPLQNGHNETVVIRIMKQLKTKEERNRFNICWYTARDMVAPSSAAYHIRTCHIKLLIADSSLGMMGSGNQDTQSWYHSQEVNVMIDSEEICKAWLKQLYGNQNSFVYGHGSEKDGIWRDDKGKKAPGSIGSGEGIGAWIKAISAIIKGKVDGARKRTVGDRV